MTFDEEGFGRINGRYAVAVRPIFGNVGDYIDYYYIDNAGNEQVIPCIICDVKGSDADNEWGHHEGKNILEFYVNEVTWCTPNWPHGHSWYKSCGQAAEMHVNPGTEGFHEEWQGYATKVVIGENYFENPNFVNETIEEEKEENGDAAPNEENNNGEEPKEENEQEEGESMGDEPLKWPTDPNASITSYFGPRTAPTEGASSYHQGIDIEATQGTPIYATESGIIIVREYKDLNGNWIKIDHGNGYESLYLHMSSFEEGLGVGSEVAKGTIIGYVGNTGVGTGPHLHFAIKLNGSYIDPLLFKYDNGKGSGTGGFGSAIDASSASTGGTGAASYYAKVATWNEVTEIVETTDPEKQQEVKAETVYTMTTTRVNYQQLVSGYTMPFDYLWALLVISENKPFISEIADLVYDSEIEITVYDNLNISTSISEDTYKRKTKVITDNIEVKVQYDGNETYKYGEKREGELEPEEYKTTTTIITKTNTLNAAVTKADVWIVDYEQEFEKQYEPEQNTGESSKEFEDEEYPDEDSPNKEDKVDTMGFANAFKQTQQSLYEQTYTDVVTEVTDLLSKYYYKIIDRNVKITNMKETTKYVSNPAKIEEKTDKKSKEDNFVTIFVDRRSARRTILRF